jgi:hypothetical protein
LTKNFMRKNPIGYWAKTTETERGSFFSMVSNKDWPFSSYYEKLGMYKHEGQSI